MPEGCDTQFVGVWPYWFDSSSHIEVPAGFAVGKMSEPSNDIACTLMPPSADIRPELVSRLSGDVPRCSALPPVELPIWPATTMPTVGPTPAFSTSVRSAPPLLPEVDVELSVPSVAVVAGHSEGHGEDRVTRTLFRGAKGDERGRPSSSYSPDRRSIPSPI